MKIKYGWTRRWWPAFLLCSATTLNAQPGRTTLMAPHLKTLQLKVDGSEERMPVIKLGSNERLEVSFDDMTHEYRRYTYKIEHCDVEGNVTDGLFESDYVQSVADEEVIEDYEPSRNTTVLYTHYKLSLPNDRLKPLLSGNYRLTVSTENENGEKEAVLQTYFGVVDTKAGIIPRCTTNTEIDWKDKHQQISMRVDLGSLPLRDAESEVKTLVLQNRRYDNAVVNAPYTAQDGNVLIWEHTRNLIFKAGNEYRKMEILSTRYPGMHGDNIRWYDPYYHYTLFQDSPRKNYLYDEDRDGAYITRCANSGDANVEADYVVTHFSLASLPMTDCEFYVNGRWTVKGLSPEYKMTYNEQTEAYEVSMLLKMGYYNYLYLCTKADNPGTGHTAPAEGDYYQTENEYDIMVYYRPTGSRYWQLVGMVTPIYKE